MSPIGTICLKYQILYIEDHVSDIKRIINDIRYKIDDGRYLIYEIYGRDE